MRAKIIYDGECSFCRSSVRTIQKMDLWGKLEYVAGPKGLSEMRFVSPEGKSYSGFFAFRQLAWKLPMLYVLIPIIYFPGAGIIGPWVYRIIARNRYFFPIHHVCSKENCSS